MSSFFLGGKKNVFLVLFLCCLPFQSISGIVEEVFENVLQNVVMFWKLSGKMVVREIVALPNEQDGEIFGRSGLILQNSVMFTAECVEGGESGVMLKILVSSTFPFVISS